ncbi:MAG: zinc-binding dehydrogenase [Nitrospirae bacterium]|nr:zinc-binding dehydrogenase [Nitrospirota bacterium]
MAHVLQSTGCNLIVVGKHKNKLALLEESGIQTVLLDNFKKSMFDVVVEASGNPSGLELGIECTKPRGTLVLKSTYASAFNFNPFPIVVNEITVVGSRCGRFSEAIKFLQAHKLPLEKYSSSVFDLKDAVSAFEFAGKPETLKVLLRIQPSSFITLNSISIPLSIL